MPTLSQKVAATVALLVLLAPPAIGAPPASFADAWTYISARNHSERWLIVVSKKSEDQYFQCENLDDVVRCDVPVWIKRLPGGKRYLPVGGRPTPYPDVEGSRLHEYIDQAKLAKAQAVFKSQGLNPVVVYGQVQDEQKKLVGTHCEVRVVVPLAYKRFEPLAKTYLKEVFGTSEADGYGFRTD
jgi:hypothetical protein